MPKRWFRRRSKKILKLRVTGLCEGNPPVTSGIPWQRASNTKMFPFDDVIMLSMQCVSNRISTYLQHFVDIAWIWRLCGYMMGYILGTLWRKQAYQGQKQITTSVSVGCKYLALPLPPAFGTQLSRAEANYYIPQYIWDVITCPYPWHLFLAHSSHLRAKLHAMKYTFIRLADVSSGLVTLDVVPLCSIRNGHHFNTTFFLEIMNEYQWKMGHSLI